MKIHALASIIIFCDLLPWRGQLCQNEVQFMANIEFMKGHLEHAVANKQGNDTSLAFANRPDICGIDDYRMKN